MIRLLGSFFLFVALVSCSSPDDGDPQCDQKFLVRHTNSQLRQTVFYNTNGKISLIIDTLSAGGSIGKLKYIYDGSGRLDEVQSIVNNEVVRKLKIYFDAQGRFVAYSRGFIELFPRDSTTITYGSDQKVSRVDVYGIVSKKATISSYSLYTYPSANTVDVKFFLRAFTEEPEYKATTTYTLDNNPLPFPKEYYYGTFFGNLNPLEHNIKGFTNVTSDGYTSSVDFQLTYNDAGFPLTYTTEYSSVEKYTYKCDPPLEP